MPIGNHWSYLYEGKQWTKTKIVYLQELQKLVSLSRTWKRQGCWFLPHLTDRSQIDHHKRTQLWLWLHLSYQMWCPYLSILTLLVHGMQGPLLIPCAWGPPEANCFQVARPAIYSHGQLYPHWYINPSASCHHLVWNGFDHLSLLQKYTGPLFVDIILIKSSE